MAEPDEGLGDDLHWIEEVKGPEEASDKDIGAPAAGETDQEFANYLERERFRSARQDREERKRYAQRIFWLVGIWLAVIALFAFLNGVLWPREVFRLSDSVLIALSTTTTAGVTMLLVLVARYLFPRS